MENHKKIIRDFQGKKVLLFGDLMLDEHIWSTVSRISPEAPVPIADVNRISHVPGGCGNVAVNIAALGGIPYLVAVIGQDSSADKLRAVLSKAKVSAKYLTVDPTRPTILKSRIIASSQQLVRVDREDKTELSANMKKNIFKLLDNLIKQTDAIVISDYGKGVVTEETAQFVIAKAKKAGKFVAIDPKGNNYSKYHGATIITPNQKEASIASKIDIADDKNLILAGKALKKFAENVLITRGKDGMSLFTPKDLTHFPAVPREVFDITGAGDTVISVLTLSTTCGASLKSSAILANTAAAVVVGKIGTAPCSREELEEALEGHEPIIKKIKPRGEIAAVVQNLRNEGAKIVFTNGCFDILHLGHARYLREAKKLGDILIVGLNSDTSVKSLKGKDRPYVSEMERAEILASLECVDYVVIFSELRPDNLIRIIKPDLHVKGGDYQIEQLPEKGLVESLGGKVVVIPPIKGRSTTNIVRKILAQK